MSRAALAVPGYGYWCYWYKEEGGTVTVQLTLYRRVRHPTT